MPSPKGSNAGIWHILRAQRGSHIPTLRPKHIPYTYVDPLGQQAELRVEIRRKCFQGNGGSVLGVLRTTIRFFDILMRGFGK